MNYVNIRSWKYSITMKDYFGLFRNSPGVVPGRWGFYIFAIEIGSRNPGDKMGLALKKCGLWPW